MDFYLQEKSRQAAVVRQEQFRMRVSIQHAVGDDVPLAFPKSPAAGNQQTVAARPPSEAEGIVRQGMLLLAAFILSAILFTRILAPEFSKAVLKQLNPWAGNARSATSLAAGVRAEDEAFGKFLVSFQTGPGVSPVSGGTDFNGQRAAGDDVPEFYAKAVRLLAAQRALLQDIQRTTEDAARHRMLADLGRELYPFKEEAGACGLLPAWQLASALEGLLKQLSDKAGDVTRSTLRTVGSAVELLEELCQPEVRKDILTHPPMRFLAVDDDLISRTAVSRALKKALNPPELADNAATALGLATRHAYDVIFLDVQMPGMDGFELCSKIHETAANQDTPVVFVTCMSDFDAYAQSTLSGGSDLLGKPFLTFEITVKALTLALRGRLRGRTLEADADVVAIASTVLSPAPTETNLELAAPAALPKPSTDCVEASQAFGSGRRSVEPWFETPPSGEADLAPARELLPEELADKFLARASAQLGAVRDQFQAVFQTADEAAWQEMLAEIYLCIHALNPRRNIAATHPAMQMSAALQGLLRKLLENPKQANPSTLVTVAAGVDLLHDLCLSGLKSDLITNPPIRMLVVDDDPLSRRAVVCALQMAFEKPEAAENGEAALVLAAERRFDVMFVDVQMPGMDGFTVCSKIRKTVLNGTTPVVFVTGQSDFNARTQMSRSGGSDFVGKPFLKSEITVKALTFALRGRLEKMEAQKPEAALDRVG